MGCDIVFEQKPTIPEKVIPSIEMLTQEGELEVGQTIQLEIKVKNYEGTIEWFSTNEEILSVSESGLATALAEGSAYVGAFFNVGSEKYTASVKVEVKESTPVIPDPIEEPDTVAPEFRKAANYQEKYQLSWNMTFDPFEDLDVVDDVDGNINNKVVVNSTINNQEYGTYQVTYTATDEAGNTATFAREVEVVYDYDVTFIGHAGCFYGLMNSEEAFLYAVQKLHYTALECDIKQTSDGVFVLSHDDTFGDYTIANTTWAVLKDVEVTKSRNSGYPSQNGTVVGSPYTTKLCTLERYLEICKEYHAKAVIELKSSAGITNSDQSRMQALMDVIASKEMLNDTIFLGSQYNCLIWTREHGYGDIECQYLVNSFDSQTVFDRCVQYDLAVSTNVTGDYTNSEEWLAKYQEAGIKVSTYTFTQYVDYPTVQHWIDLGVDYVTCDWQLMSNLNLPKGGKEEIVTHTVTFKDIDGRVLKTATVKDGKAAAAPADPVKAGYRFIGWDKPLTNVTEDYTVTAQYEVITYTITYYKNNEIVEEASWESKEAFVNEFYTDLFNWLSTKGVANVDQITKEGDTIKMVKNGVTVTFSNVDELKALDIYDFEKTISNVIYAPVTREADDSCVILPNEAYFLNSSEYRVKYQAVDAFLMHAINTGYSAYSKTYVPTSAGKIQIFFRFHQWAKGTNIAAFSPLPVKYIATEDPELLVTLPTSPVSYTVEDSFTLPAAEANKQFLGWFDNPDGSGKEYKVISKGTTGDLVLYAKWSEAGVQYYSISYVYEEGKPIENPCANMDEFRSVFWSELYAWSGSTKAFDTFKDEALAAWKAGNVYGGAKVYASGEDGKVVEGYFVSCEDNFARWMPWMQAFEAAVHEINGSQSAWGSTYVGYLRLYALLMESASYWNETRKQSVYSKVTVPVELPTQYNVGQELDIPGLFLTDGREFIGWYDNPEYTGTPIAKITADMRGNLVLYSKFSPKVVATAFEINQPTRIEKFDTVQLEWTFTPSDTSLKTLNFISSDPTVLSISNKGLITAHKEGHATITVEVLSNRSLDVSWDVEVYFDPFIDGTYKTSSVVKTGEIIELEATAYGSDAAIVWESKNESIATVNNGVVTGVAAGFAEIVAKLSGTDVTFTFGVTVSDGSEELALVEASHNAESYVTRNLNVAYAYLTDVILSVSDLYYNYEYTINRDYEPIQANVTSNHGGKISKVEFICVHYTAGYQKSSTAKANASYFAGGSGGTSIHYTTGNDGIYSILPDDTVGFHAGDGTGVAFQWIPTGVMTSENVKPVWGVVKNSASSSGYYFTLNGQATTIVVPTTGTTSSGASKTMTDPSKCFTYYGPAWKVVDGQYYMGNTWACFTQTLEGAISSRGGNLNSIGIETACNIGSDLWMTYQYTAQLVAHLVRDNNLDLTRVVGHNMFSGKDCPQTLLANNGELWVKFMECLEAEYKKLTEMDNYEFTFTTDNPELVDEHGRILSIPKYSTTVTYTVTVKNKTTNEVKTEKFATIIHGSYTE